MKRFHCLKLTAALLISLPGCTSVKNVQEFGKAARIVSDSAKKGFADFDDQLASATRESKVLAGEKLKNEDVRKFFLPGSKYSMRLDALDQLAAYATALEALATHNPSENLKTAGQGIKTALVGINTDLADKGSPFSTQDIGIIAGLFVAGADIYLEQEREKHLRAIIQKANPGVQETARLLEREFNAMPGVLTGGLAIAADTMMTALHDNKDKWQLSEQRDVGALIQQTRDNQTKLPAACAAVAVAAKKMAVAHAKLAAIAAGGKLSSEDSWAAIKDFADRARNVKDIFDSVSAAK